MLLTIHVRPNASTTVVGGAHDGALVVRVAEPVPDHVAVLPEENHR